MDIYRQILSEDFLKEVTPLLEKNKEEINHWSTSLNFDKDIYIYADIADNYRAYVARDNGVIVGYIGYWIHQDPHNVDIEQATQDLLYVDKSSRVSWIGMKLLKYSEKDLKDFGVKQILQQSPTSNPIDPLFKRLGYKDTAVVYIKEI